MSSRKKRPAPIKCEELFVYDMAHPALKFPGKAWRGMAPIDELIKELPEGSRQVHPISNWVTKFLVPFVALLTWGTMAWLGSFTAWVFLTRQLHFVGPTIVGVSVGIVMAGITLAIFRRLLLQNFWVIRRQMNLKRDPKGDTITPNEWDGTYTIVPILHTARNKESWTTKALKDVIAKDMAKKLGITDAGVQVYTASNMYSLMKSAAHKRFFGSGYSGKYKTLQIMGVIVIALCAVGLLVLYGITTAGG